MLKKHTTLPSLQGNFSIILKFTQNNSFLFMTSSSVEPSKNGATISLVT